jgi:hypothetical protein
MNLILELIFEVVWGENLKSEVFDIGVYEMRALIYMISIKVTAATTLI